MSQSKKIRGLFKISSIFNKALLHGLSFKTFASDRITFDKRRAEHACQWRKKRLKVKEKPCEMKIIKSEKIKLSQALTKTRKSFGTINFIPPIESLKETEKSAKNTMPIGNYFGMTLRRMPKENV